MDWVKEVDSLCLSGGGIRGLGLLGALKELEKTLPGFLSRLKNVAGTSIGSLIAVMLASGHPLTKIEDMFFSNIWNSLYQEIDFGRVSETYGLIDMRNRLQKTVEGLLHHPEETFAELKKRTGVSLTVTATCMETREIEHHNDVLTPLLPIVPSVLASCAIPLIFAPIKISGRTFVDGGLLLALPVPTHFDLSKTIALFIRGANAKSFVVREKSLYGVLNYLTDIMYLVTTHVEHLYMERLPLSFRTRIVTFTFDNTIRAFDFHLNDEQRRHIYRQGAEVMCKFLNAPTILIGDLVATLISDYAFAAIAPPAPTPTPLLPDTTSSAPPDPDWISCASSKELP